MGITSFAVALMMTMVIMSHSIYGREFYDDLQEIKIQKLLKQLNKPALKSIESEDGDIIDCVPLTSQPAFDHPLLKNHTIQMRPSFIPESDSAYTNEKAEAITQVWHKNGEYCPDNTIPIRRVKKEDILRAKSIESFGKKTPPGIVEVTASGHHEYAVAGGTLTGGKSFGTKASINLWKPNVASNDEFSLSQTWLVSGSGGSLNTIEAGWQVYQQLYGDYNTRLFVYWTRDGYQKTGCYNLLCQGFVQTNKQYSVGGSFSTVSQYNGAQYELNLLIWKDQPTGNWWLVLNDNIFMGYWPGSLFSSLGSGATRVEWGGEVYVRDGAHSTTDMGSGHFAVEGFRKASYIRNLMTVDGSNTLRQAVGLYSIVTNNNCYSYKKGSDGTTFGTHFYYGGPGKNGNCP